MGSIGCEVAKKASTLGMRVIASREHTGKEKPLGVDEIFSSDQIERVLVQSDYVVLAVPLTADARGLIDRKRLGAMKPGACLINVGPWSFN